MASIDIEQLLKELKDESAALAKATFKKFKAEAEQDAMDLISSMKEDIKKWTLMLANGQLTKDEFEWLVMSKKELIVMVGLKQAGLTLIKLDELKAKLLNLVITKVFSLI
jgi:uncharacterized protein YecA (UPF0149 family)